MSQFSVWFTNLVLIVSVYTAAGQNLTECKQNDMACVEKNANTLYQMIMSGDPERHVEPHEPLHHELIEGNLSILKYKFFNSTFMGMNTCKISNLNWNFQASLIRFDVTCGNITMYGKYEIDGRLIILPIKGEGDYKIDTHGYKISVECEIDEIDGSDGNKHLHIHTYRLKETPTAPIVFSLDNLFNGQKEMSDTLHKFANDNWKEVAELVQDPVWYAHAKTLISVVNKYLKLRVINFFMI
ncbi:circadian clock-controlled protein daywake-like [Aricia agestis]|uniref:circadian clock-controlled protein daywake-like n=1 Tax=Aricia agestis TaxID=91739 RepID=UPI001C208E2F|nr:circadian clock-controlled protein daywake-like [Aricia agestis]